MVPKLIEQVDEDGNTVVDDSGDAVLVEETYDETVQKCLHEIEITDPCVSLEATLAAKAETAEDPESIIIEPRSKKITIPAGESCQVIIRSVTSEDAILAAFQTGETSTQTDISKMLTILDKSETTETNEETGETTVTVPAQQYDEKTTTLVSGSTYGFEFDNTGRVKASKNMDYVLTLVNTSDDTEHYMTILTLGGSSLLAGSAALLSLAAALY
jgi:hypothetical protein